MADYNSEEHNSFWEDNRIDFRCENGFKSIKKILWEHESPDVDIEAIAERQERQVEDLW